MLATQAALPRAMLCAQPHAQVFALPLLLTQQPSRQASRLAAPATASINHNVAQLFCRLVCQRLHISMLGHVGHYAHLHGRETGRQACKQTP